MVIIKIILYVCAVVTSACVVALQAALIAKILSGVSGWLSGVDSAMLILKCIGVVASAAIILMAIWFSAIWSIGAL